MTDNQPEPLETGRARSRRRPTPGVMTVAVWLACLVVLASCSARAVRSSDGEFAADVGDWIDPVSCSTALPAGEPAGWEAWSAPCFVTDTLLIAAQGLECATGRRLFVSGYGWGFDGDAVTAFDTPRLEPLDRVPTSALRECAGEQPSVFADVNTELVPPGR
ncbi:MAG: hypothetical protein RIE08_02595 [Acidimicrobiales bacterium]